MAPDNRIAARDAVQIRGFGEEVTANRQRLLLVSKHVLHMSKQPVACWPAVIYREYL